MKAIHHSFASLCLRHLFLISKCCRISLVHFRAARGGFFYYAYFFFFEYIQWKNNNKFHSFFLTFFLFDDIDMDILMMKKKRELFWNSTNRKCRDRADFFSDTHWFYWHFRYIGFFLRFENCFLILLLLMYILLKHFYI